MRTARIVSISIVTGLCGVNPAVAADICAALLAQGIRDTSSQHVSEARFNELKSNVCNTNYDTYSKAASQAISGGFDLPGVFGISFGSANANAEYSEKWTKFCRSDYGLAISNSELKTYFSTANRAVLNSFDNCVNVTTERFLRFVEPQPDGRSYSITFDNRRQGNATFRVFGISLTNSTTGQVMNVVQTCDVPPPFNRNFPWDTGVRELNTNAFSITCRRDPNHTIVVAGTTSAGNIAPVVVQPVPTPGPTIADRVSALEANLAAAVPNGAILTWFSKTGPIPSGWGLCDGTRGPNLQGFFLRGGASTSDLTDTKGGSNTHRHTVGELSTLNPPNGVNRDVKQERGQPLSVSGIDHIHKINSFSTLEGDNVPEYKSVLFLCR